MVIASALALKRGMITEDDDKRIKELCNRAKLPVAIPDDMTGKDFIVHMRHDKKVREGTICYVLPVALGKVNLYKDVSDDEVIALIKALKA